MERPPGSQHSAYRRTTMPSKSEKQHNAMEAAAHGKSNVGIPEKVAKKFLAHDKAEGKFQGTGKKSTKKSSKK